ncbi:MAG: alpha/beta hydrolase [Oscillospiraceae bacterium]
MEQRFSIGHIPAALYGPEGEQVWLYLHGQGGHKEEAAALCAPMLERGVQVLGVDLPGHGERAGEPGFDPWTVTPELREVLAYVKGRWTRRSLFAVSIGAWFSLLAFPDERFARALFLSPVLDMEGLIRRMMGWAGVTEEQLRRAGEIPTDFGQTLSWRYLCYVREHPLRHWESPTAILYGERDQLTDYATAESFACRFGCGLTVVPGGEHWFHTAEQLAALRRWEEAQLI